MAIGGSRLNRYHGTIPNDPAHRLPDTNQKTHDVQIRVSHVFYRFIAETTMPDSC